MPKPKKTSTTIHRSKKTWAAGLLEFFLGRATSSLGMEFQFRLPVQIWQEQGHFVAFCPVLQVTSYGDSKKDAQKNIKEAVELFLEVCVEDGTLNKVLRECGMKRRVSEVPTEARQESLIQGSVPVLAG